jgi:hypothetical protein
MPQSPGERNNNPQLPGCICVPDRFTKVIHMAKRSEKPHLIRMKYPIKVQEKIVAQFAMR